MPTKDFERTFQFRQVQKPDGNSIWLPLVEVILITSTNSRVTLSLFFDTGATTTTLSKVYYPLLGLSRWNEGPRVRVGTGKGGTYMYRYNITLEIWGKTIEDCPILLAPFEPNSLFGGLLGRELVFEQFGFGFWESAHELYVTMNP